MPATTTNDARGGYGGATTERLGQRSPEQFGSAMVTPLPMCGTVDEDGDDDAADQPGSERVSPTPQEWV